MHVWSLFQLATDYLYAIALKIIVLSLSYGQTEHKMCCEMVLCSPSIVFRWWTDSGPRMYAGGLWNVSMKP